MKREDVNEHTGYFCQLNGDGDLGVQPELRRYIHDRGKNGLRIIRLEKGGMVLLRDTEDREVQVPPRNVELAQWWWIIPPESQRSEGT